MPLLEELPLRELLARQTAPGSLVRDLGQGRLECTSCGHRCTIGVGKEGICRVRFNDYGTLRVPWGYVGSLQLDPIEKKPFYHALPGSMAMSFGMLGCDYHCAYCQNWITSQTLRDPEAISRPERISPEELVALAIDEHARIVTSTYNEPLITSEWAVAIFKVARRLGLVTSYVSNGNGTPEVLDFLQPWVDLYKVDLKGFNDRQYRKLGGVLQNVLDTIRSLHERRIWTEVVTLIVPGLNDSDGELRDLAGFLASVSPDIPWHVTAFHADYRMGDAGHTPARSLLRAAEIGDEAGLHFVYAGNIPGAVGKYENTYCPSCHELLIERRGFRVIHNGLALGRCPKCTTPIPGFWEAITRSAHTPH
jgi:pyruvate formate lyase activating enzyme